MSKKEHIIIEKMGIFDYAMSKTVGAMHLIY